MMMNRILFLTTLCTLLLISVNSALAVRVRAQVEENEVDYDPRELNEEEDRRELESYEEYSPDGVGDSPVEMNEDEDPERELGDYDEEDEEDDYPEEDRELGGYYGKKGGYYGGKKGGYYGGYYGGKKGYSYGKGKG